MNHVESVIVEAAKGLRQPQIQVCRSNMCECESIFGIDAIDALHHHLACLHAICGEYERLDMESEFLSVEEVAEYLGVNRSTVSRLIDDCELRAIRVGKRWRIKRSDLDRWEQRSQSKPPDDE
jgi:excisionase family DNA binding protein